VFVSAGDRSNIHHWLRGRRDFDLWIVYYGNEAGKFLDVADFRVSRKGSKFQNLHYCYGLWADTLQRYESIMVMDDDIVIDATALTHLFEMRRERDLWLLQPAFRLRGKISWDITRVRPTAQLRYTNYVEMACPLFRRDKLDAFMEVYDPELVGYGADWWFLHCLGELEGRVAVVDAWPCINPFDKAKGGAREIDQLQSHEERKRVWERMKVLHGLDEQGRHHIEFGRVARSAPGAALAVASYVSDWTYVETRKLARRMIHGLGAQRDAEHPGGPA